MNKKTVHKLSFVVCVLLFGSLLFAVSCEDIFEKDITNKELLLIAPGDSLKTSFSTQTFWWEELDGALTYTLQVVSPSFASIEKVLVDTTLKKNKFTLNLYPGKFEWRVRAENGSFKSPYIIRTIQVDSTMDLKGQKVTLISPFENAYSSTLVPRFTWQKLYNADTYSLEVHQANWNGALVFSSNPVTYDTLSVSTLSEGIYYWGIKAWNNNSATEFSTRVLTIDRTLPGVPTLSTPLDKAKIPQLPVNLVWSNASDIGSPLTDSILVSSDSTFSPNKIVVAKYIQDTRLDGAVADTGTYFWKVKSVDAAKNQGIFSAIRKFTVQSK